MATDRHRAGYYKDYNERRKQQGKSVDRHRPGYYEDYAKKHPAWAEKHMPEQPEEKICEKTTEENNEFNLPIISW